MWFDIAGASAIIIGSTIGIIIGHYMTRDRW